MSPKRLEATMTSKRSGSSTIFAASASISSESHRTSGNSAAQLGDDLVPERHRVHDPVALGRRGDVAATRVRASVEGVVGDPAHPGAGEDRFLDCQLVREAAVHPAADLAVLTLDVLPHHDQVDLAGRGRPQWALHAVEDRDRALVDVLPEGTADRDQQAPQRHMVGHPRPAHGAEQDRVVRRQRVERVVRHHRAGLGVATARPVELVVRQVDVVQVRDDVEHPTSSADDLGADPVSGDDRDALRHPVTRDRSRPPSSAAAGR